LNGESNLFFAKLTTVIGGKTKATTALRQQSSEYVVDNRHRLKRN